LHLFALEPLKLSLRSLSGRRDNVCGIEFVVLVGCKR
jgi:hypothetical protein